MTIQIDGKKTSLFVFSFFWVVQSVHSVHLLNVGEGKSFDEIC